MDNNHLIHKYAEYLHEEELHRRAAQGDEKAKRELRKISNGKGAGILTGLGVIAVGAMAGVAAPVLGPVALGAAGIAKLIAHHNTK